MSGSDASSSLRSLHVVFLCGEYPPAAPGGVGTFTQTLGRALVDAGHRVTVVGFERRAAVRFDDDRGVTVHRLPVGKIAPRAPWHARRLQRHLRELHGSAPIDVVEGAEGSHALAPGQGRRDPWIRLIRMHGGHHFFALAAGRAPAPWRSYLEKHSFRVAHRLCAVSHYVADQTRETLHLGNRPIEILPNPIDTRLIAPDAQDTTRGRVTFAGSLVEKKGVRQLVQAVPQVAQRVPEFHLEVYGRDTRTQGRSFRELLENLLPPEHRSRVTFHGPVEREELIEALRTAEVLTYPSHMEAMPLAWLEGMALGKAVLASRTGPGPEVIEHGVHGLLCDPYDPSSIAAGLIELLEDEQLRSRLGAAARRRVERHFSLETLLERNIAYYRSISD